jgi:hypothetical protein
MNKPVEHTAQAPKRIQREESAGFDRTVIDYIHNAAAHGLYEIRGLGAKRKLPHFAIRSRAIARSAPPRRSWAPATRRSRWSWTFPSRSPA